MITGIVYFSYYTTLTSMRDDFHFTKIRAMYQDETYDIYDKQFKRWCFSFYEHDIRYKASHIYDTLL